MGKRGPKTQPNALPEPGPLPDPPEWLEDSVSLQHWHKYGPILNRLGLLESLDAVAFGMLCDAIACFLSARDQLPADELVVYVGENGAAAQNPLVSIIRQQAKAIKDLLSEFGMTPSSRTGLTGSTSVERTAKELDPLEELAKQFGSAEPPPKPTTPRRRLAKKKAAKKKAAKKRPTKKRTQATR